MKNIPIFTKYKMSKIKVDIINNNKYCHFILKKLHVHVYIFSEKKKDKNVRTS